MEPTREQVLELLKETVKADSLRRHLLAVEACMSAYARHYGEDEARWAIVGLLHDFDWDICPTPQSHPQFGANLLRRRGYPEELVRAVLSHGDHTGIPRETRMEVALFAVDEMSGFVTAVALVRPSKSLSETTPQSVRKKLKDRAFAAKVNRDDLVKGAQELGVDFDEHVARVIEALKPVAAELGLNP